METDRIIKTKDMRTEYGYCPYCKRYIGGGCMAAEHKKICKSVSPEVREIHRGIKHKNGVEIYEDDKFQYHEHEGYILPDFTGEILFMDGCFGYVATSENMGEAFHSFSEFDELQADFLDHIEVIGNIHDKK